MSTQIAESGLELDRERAGTTLAEGDRATGVVDPVCAYDRIAAIFAKISMQRSAYLDSIDSVVIDNVPASSRSLLDVGAGDGRRALKIARAAGISEVVLLEPSREMQRHWPAEITRWTMRAEDLGEESRRFDVITCLWNVLGHIPAARRASVLMRLRGMLNSHGVLYLDVNHRYNARAYGAAKTLLRYVHDLFRPAESNGDVLVRWAQNGVQCTTSGHVFVEKEVRALLRDSRLKVDQRFVVDYATGQVRRGCFEGHLLYVLRPECSIIY